MIVSLSLTSHQLSILVLLEPVKWPIEAAASSEHHSQAKLTDLNKQRLNVCRSGQSAVGETLSMHTSFQTTIGMCVTAINGAAFKRQTS